MRELTLLVPGEPVQCTVGREGEELIVVVHGTEQRFRLAPVEPGLLLVTAGGRSRIVHTAEDEEKRYVHMDGVTLEYTVTLAGGRPGAGPAPADLTAPMPGLVTQVLVREGDVVRPGQPLVIVEAMKMEHVIRAARAGTVRAIRVRAGEQVDGGAVVAEVGPPESSPGGSRREAGRG